MMFLPVSNAAVPENPPPSMSMVAPFGNYHHGVLADGPSRYLFTSGQLGISKADAIPESALEQARLCFANVAEILAGADMSPANVVRINAYVTSREHFPAYMQARDEFVTDPPPASTLVIVSGFTREEFKVEVEVTALA